MVELKAYHLSSFFLRKEKVPYPFSLVSFISTMNVVATDLCTVSSHAW